MARRPAHGLRKYLDSLLAVLQDDAARSSQGLKLTAHPGSVPEPGVFELSLALTGTVSAGCYTSGVLDFLRLALDAWEEAKARGEAVPGHRVRLHGLAGTSGGAICATLFAAGLARTCPTPSALHRAWVEGMDFNKLLQAPAQPEVPLPALLDSSALDENGRRAMAALAAAPPAPWRPWAADPFTLRLALGNVTGVPYWMPMEGEAGAGDGYTMIAHADYAGYGVSPSGAACRPGDVALPPLDGTTAAAWFPVVGSALASAAFPVAFRARVQDFPVALRNARPLVAPFAPNLTVGVEPRWPEGFGPSYRSYNIDGGSMDNEPIDLARELLAGPGGRNERDPQLAQRMVLMVGPFVHELKWKPEPIESAWQALSGMLAAGKDNATFKPVDLVLAALKEVGSRWVIAPSRPPSVPFAPPTPILSGGMGGFGSFLHRSFRQYDYDLGRYNCQRFLERGFRLPALNPGFLPSGAPGEQPVIPLVGPARVPVPPPVYPSQGTFTDQDLQVLEGNLGRRLDHIARSLLASLEPDALERLGLTLAWKLWARNKLKQGVRQTVARMLKAYRL